VAVQEISRCRISGYPTERNVRTLSFSFSCWLFHRCRIRLSFSLAIHLLTATYLRSLSVLTDVMFTLVPVNPWRFPGAPWLAKVHMGFQMAHGRTADTILKAVRKVIAERRATTVTTVGHSLGGALALLEGLHLRLNLPEYINIITRTLGQPRVSFSVFVNWTLN
jgi:predicted lipase